MIDLRQRVAQEIMGKRALPSEPAYRLADAVIALVLEQATGWRPILELGLGNECLILAKHNRGRVDVIEVDKDMNGEWLEERGYEAYQPMPEDAICRAIIRRAAWEWRT
jgi:hypothetical protein